VFPEEEVTKTWRVFQLPDQDAYHIVCTRYRIQKSAAGEILYSKSEFLNPQGQWIEYEDFGIIEPVLTIPGILVQIIADSPTLDGTKWLMDRLKVGLVGGKILVTEDGLLPEV